MQPGWGYLLAHPDAVAISVQRPLAFVLIAVLVAFIALAPERSWRAVLSWRLIAFTALVFALAGLALSARLPSDRLSVIAAVDVSQSIDEEGRRWEERYINELGRSLAPGDELGVVVFGSDARLARPPGAPRPLQIGRDATVTSATNIARALQTAVALLGADTAHRIVLVSDGNETRGDSRAEIPRTRAAHAAIFAAVPPHVHAADVAVDKLTLPPLVTEGTVFPLRVTLRNSAPARPVQFTLSVDGSTIGRESVLLQPGLNSIEVPYRLHGPGGHRVRAQVAAPDDPVPGNDYRESAVMVSGPSRVLLVAPHARSPLAAVLERKDTSVTLQQPAAFPSRLDDLVSYHAVILQDVGAASLPGAKLETLERYVRDFGGGLIVSGGDATFGDAGFKKTALERMLPVTLEPRRPPRAEREPLALFILIDRSNSMGYHIVNRLERSETESKLAYAKRAALAVVTQLKDTDLVGLFAFDSQPFAVSHLLPLKQNREQLSTDIPRLQPGGGTDFYDALESARKELAESGTDTKHIVLLTDGDTNRGAADHYPLIAALAKAEISVTTIRIGDDTVNLTLLHDISGRTGGEFYHVEDVASLPELLLKDTTAAMTQAPRHEQTFTPHMAGVSQVTRGLPDNQLPELSGYAYARSKAGADLLAYISGRDKRDPLLDVWQYGLGRVVAFTAGVDTDAERWVGWDGFGKFWSQIVHWALRDQTAWDYALEVHRRDGRSMLTVRSFDDLDDGVLQARLFAAADQPIDLTLTPQAPREFSAALPPLPGGEYGLTITRRSGAQEVTQRTQTISVPAADEQPQEEFETDGPNRPLLQQLAAATGGAVDAPIRDIVSRAPGTRRVDYPLDWIWIPIAMGAFLIDVALRRLRPRLVAVSAQR